MILQNLLTIAGNAQTSDSMLGVITAIDAVNASLTVQTAAPTPITGVRWLAHYTPTVDDFVVILRAGNGWWVVGKNSKDPRADTRAYGTADYTISNVYQGHEYVADSIGNWSVTDIVDVGLWNSTPGMPSMDERKTALFTLGGEVPSGATITAAKLHLTLSKEWEFGYPSTLKVASHSYPSTPAWPASFTNEIEYDPIWLEIKPREYVFDLPSVIASSLAAGTARGIHVRAADNYGLLSIWGARVVIDYFIGG